MGANISWMTPLQVYHAYSRHHLQKHQQLGRKSQSVISSRHNPLDCFPSEAGTDDPLDTDTCRQPKASGTYVSCPAETCVADLASIVSMRNRLRGRVGVVQLAALAVVGVGLGLMLGFMFMSVVDTVSHQALCISSDKLCLDMLGVIAASSAQSWISGPG